MSNKKRMEALAKADPILGAVIKELKLKPLGKRTDHFESLVGSIISQQLSGKAADTIFGRFVALFPGNKFPEAAEVARTPLPKLRKAGLSRGKATYIKDLARRVAKGEIDFAKIHLKKDEEVITELVKVKGIGRWTAEMFLIFFLRRPDVFSAGDLGLQNAVKKLYRMKKHPTPAQMERLARRWAPHRSLAALYLWRSLDNR
jgi:DNA-3-methyladenine glycosylase II